MSVSRKSFLTGVAALPAAALLAACGNPSGSAGGSGATTPVKHALGTAEVPESPTRIAAVNWLNHDVLLALGIMPVGFAKQTWGVEDDSGMLIWVKEKVDALVADGAERPTLFDETSGIDFEGVSSTKPEVIIATYSGLEQADYDKLAKIAPTVAYPTIPWGTPWRESITITASAIGKKAEGDALVTDMEKLVADTVAAHPQIKGKRSAFFYVDEQSGSIGFYTPVDPRTAFLADLGLPLPDSIKTIAAKDSTTFAYEVSKENADQLSDLDLVVMYGKDEDLAGYQSNALLSAIPAFKNGAVAFVGNGDSLSASANPSPLATPWGIEKYTALIAAAADKAA